jgi:hypothetical protein
VTVCEDGIYIEDEMIKHNRIVVEDVGNEIGLREKGFVLLG